jgi:hypothetical protein
VTARPPRVARAGRGRGRAVGDVGRECARIVDGLQALVARLARAGGVSARLPALRRSLEVFLGSPFVRLYGLTHVDDLLELSATLSPAGRSLCRANCYDLDPPALRAALRAVGGRAHAAAIDAALALGADAGARLGLGLDLPPAAREARRKVYVFLWELEPARRPRVVARAAALVGAAAPALRRLELERASVLGFDFSPGAAPELKLYLRYADAERAAALDGGAGGLGPFSAADVARLAEDRFVAPRLDEVVVSYDVGARVAPRAAYLGLRALDGWPDEDAAFVDRFLGAVGLQAHAAAVKRAFLRPPLRQTCYVSLTRTRAGAPRVTLYYLTGLAGRRPATAAGDAGSAAAAAGAAFPGARFSCEASAAAARVRLHFEPLRPGSRYYRRTRGYGVAYVTECEPPDPVVLAPLLAWLDGVMPTLDSGPGTTPAHVRARLEHALERGLPPPWRAGPVLDEA